MSSESSAGLVAARLRELLSHERIHWTTDRDDCVLSRTADQARIEVGSVHDLVVPAQLQVHFQPRHGVDRKRVAAKLEERPVIVGVAEEDPVAGVDRQRPAVFAERDDVAGGLALITRRGVGVGEVATIGLRGNDDVGRREDHFLDGHCPTVRSNRVGKDPVVAWVPARMMAGTSRASRHSQFRRIELGRGMRATRRRRVSGKMVKPKPMLPSLGRKRQRKPLRVRRVRRCAVVLSECDDLRTVPHCITSSRSVGRR